MSTPDLDATLAALGDDERRTLAYLAGRLLLGQRTYGAIDLATDPRDFTRERGEEISDLLVYTAFAALRAEVVRAATSALVLTVAEDEDGHRVTRIGVPDVWRRSRRRALRAAVEGALEDVVDALERGEVVRVDVSR